MKPLKDKAISKNSTIYNYRLLKRVYHNRIIVWAIWALPVCLLVLDLRLRYSVLPLLLGLAAVPLAHTLFIRLLYTMKEGRAPRGWLWSWDQPWLGTVPGSYISLSKLLGIQLHLFWMTLVIVCCFYPWTSPIALAHILFVHLWIMLPRFIIFFRMRRFTAEGYLRISKKETSCYEQ